MPLPETAVLQQFITDQQAICEKTTPGNLAEVQAALTNALAMLQIVVDETEPPPEE